MQCRRPRGSAGVHCAGVPVQIGKFAQLERRHGHNVVVGRLSPDDLAYGYDACTKCVACSTVYLKGLGRPCPPKCTRTTHRNKLERNEHPQTGVPIGEPVPYCPWAPTPRPPRGARAPIPPPGVVVRREWPDAKRRRKGGMGLPTVCEEASAAAGAPHVGNIVVSAVCTPRYRCRTKQTPAAAGAGSLAELPAAAGAGHMDTPAAAGAGPVHEHNLAAAGAGCVAPPPAAAGAGTVDPLPAMTEAGPFLECPHHLPIEETFFCSCRCRNRRRGTRRFRVPMRRCLGLQGYLRQGAHLLCAALPSQPEGLVIFEPKLAEPWFSQH